MTDHVPPEGVEPELVGSRKFDQQSIRNSRSNEHSARSNHRDRRLWIVMPIQLKTSGLSL